MKLKTPKNNLKESSSGPFIDWETNKKARKEVLDWWADVEEWNAANDYPYYIENDTNDVSGMFTAIYDMAKDLKKDAPELYKRGKAINNRYGYSQIKESIIKESRKVYVVEPHKIDMDLYDIVFIDNGKRASSKRFESYEDAVKFIKKNARYNNWIAGNKADFQSKEDKLTDFGKSIKSSKINESLKEAPESESIELTRGNIIKVLKQSLGYEPHTDSKLRAAQKKQKDYDLFFDKLNSIAEVYPIDKSDAEVDEIVDALKVFNKQIIISPQKTSISIYGKNSLSEALEGYKKGDKVLLRNGLEAIIVREHKPDGYIINVDGKEKYIADYGIERKIRNLQNNSLSEDTIKQNGKWVNKGKEGTHGKFRTKKEADAQRKAMFANGYKDWDKKETLKEDYSDECWAVFIKDQDTGKVYCDGCYDSRGMAGYWAAIDVNDYRTIYNKNFKLDRIEKVPEYSSDLFNSNNELIAYLLGKSLSESSNKKNRYAKLKEASTKPLTAKDKADIKNKLNTTDDSELITAYVASKGAKKKDTNQTSVTESADGKANDATDIVKLIDKEFPELEFVDEKDLDNNQVGLIFDGASKVDPVDLGTYLDGLYVWYKIKGDKLLIKADEDANYLEEDVKGGWEDPEWRKYYGVDDDSFYDPYELEDNIDIEYDEEEDF